MYTYRHRRGFDFGDFTITKREIIASISIIAIMVIIGVLISNKISEHQMDKNEKYNKAVKIETIDLFQYGMETNVGDAFVYGDLCAVDAVTYPEIGGEYMYIEKVKEQYTRHTRTVTKTKTVNGKTVTYTDTEVYYTWDRVGRDSLKCNEITFLGIKFDSGKIDMPISHHIDTIKESSKIRYKYYGVKSKHTGTIFTDLRDGTISDNTNFYVNMDIDETVDYLGTDVGVIIFWVFWIVLTLGCVYGFYYLDNNWLE